MTIRLFYTLKHFYSLIVIFKAFEIAITFFLYASEYLCNLIAVFKAFVGIGEEKKVLSFLILYFYKKEITNYF